MGNPSKIKLRTVTKNFFYGKAFFGSLAKILGADAFLGLNKLQKIYFIWVDLYRPLDLSISEPVGRRGVVLFEK